MKKRLLLLMMILALLFAAAWVMELAGRTPFQPERIEGCTFAELHHNSTGQMIHLISEHDMDDLESLLLHAEEMEGKADCPFDAELTLILADGEQLRLKIATDDCSVYRVNGRDYRYGRNLVSDPDSSPDSSVLFTLFNMDAKGNYAEDHPTPNAWTFGQAPLYLSPADTQPVAVLPPVARVLWLSTTADYAFGRIETVVNGKLVQGYVPWLDLQAYSTGTEAEHALSYLQTELGWTQEELDACQMYVPMTAQRHQFSCVSVMSRMYPHWRYDVWVDYLTDCGLHDIQTPFTGSLAPDERAIRDTLHSGTLKTADEVQHYFLTCYGPQESWSPALTEWVARECALLAQ